MKKFLIIGSGNYSNRRIKKELRKLGHVAKIANPLKFNILLSDKKRRDRIYYNKNRIYKTTIDCIIPRIGSQLAYGAASVEQMQTNIGIKTTSSATGLLNASNKLKSMQLMSSKGVLVPKTMYIKKSDNFAWMVKKLGGFPIVAKLIRGSQGVGTFILNDELSASTALETFSSLKQHLILQTFIKTAEEKQKANDIRAIVIGGRVIGAYKRYSLDSDFRSNFSISKLGEKYTLSDEQKTIAVKAAEAVGLWGCAGVDLAENVNNGKTYCYEVNGNFSIYGFEKVTEINAAKEIAMFAQALASNIENGDFDKGEESAEEFSMGNVVDESGIGFKDEFNIEDVDVDINEYSIKIDSSNKSQIKQFISYSRLKDQPYWMQGGINKRAMEKYNRRK